LPARKHGARDRTKPTKKVLIGFDCGTTETSGVDDGSEAVGKVSVGIKS